MLPVMMRAADVIRADLGWARMTLAAAPNIEPDTYHRMVGGREIDIRTGVTPEILAASDLVITSSGTATVEAAYFGTPMVVVYRTGFATYQIARRLVSLDNIAMVNIIAGRKIVPELIQSQATASAIAGEALNLLHDPSRYDTMVRDLRQVREALGDGNAGQKAWEAIRQRVAIC